MIKRYSNNNYDLLTELVKTSFKLKYNGSILGFLWVLLKPFLQFSILYVVFSRFGGNDKVENFTIYLISGLIIYAFFQEVIMSGISALLGKAGIILKVNFDKKLAIYSVVILGLINLIINFIIIIIFVIFNPIEINLLSFIYIGIIIGVMSLLATGVAFFTSIITVRLKDLQHIAEVGIQMLFYATPIIYHIDSVPEPYKSILVYNPLFIFIQSIRNAMISGQISFLAENIILAIISLIIFVSGWIFFNKSVRKIAQYF